MKIFQLLAIVSVAFAIISCSEKGPRFVVEGQITDADSVVLYLEKRELNKVTFLDSVKLDSKGDFKFRGSATSYPEFYVLRLNGQVINFVVDSTESVKIESAKNTFATNYNIESSDANQQIKNVTLAQYKANQQLADLQQKFNNKEINEGEYIAQIQSIANEYKDTARKVIYYDFKSPAAYFALFQKVGDYLFFDPYDKADYRLFAAVATSWDTYYSDSPRTPHLKDYTLLAMKVRKQNEQVISEDIMNSATEVSTSDYYNIELPDANNKQRSIASLKGKVILVDFTVYQTENSPAHNIALNKIYNKFKPNLEIYQVSFDSDVHFWKNAAVNLPWIAV
ncbi:DUF4369 domain-containing protein, partial [Dysgonomonas sp. OttesenSCG-928-M03]|nr:DUF4369 domain-containing protein [Dysgonomonas sp. OttesenSCG-928-M03]